MLWYFLAYLFNGFVSGSRFIVSSAYESKPIMIILSSCLALALILNVRTGAIIVRNMGRLMTPENQNAPINIVSRLVQARNWPRELLWRFYDDLPSAMILKNNGCAVILSICCENREMIPYVTGGELGQKYYFVEASFKWSLQHSVEHSIDGHKFSLEMQALHRCPEREAPFEYLTISHLFVTTYQINGKIGNITNNLQMIRSPGSVAELPPFDLSSLMTTFENGFFSYRGTYDNGQSKIATQWFINSRICGIGLEQLNKFGELCGVNGKTISQNTRKIRPMGNRSVLYH
ncbi:carbonic anhydrase 1 [Drosophila willistoni]|uniref:carbonic anhydrase 1 n=1 Tax=Drosophila willistoni TaxID=7260 RepID=UPI000C26D7A7|nr:carbonic anhydrase 1 [Drosophila willistoni]